VFEFALNIGDETGQLSPDNGIKLSELGQLSLDLDNAINAKDGHKCTLFKIENHGYTPHFKTESKLTYQNFIEVHKNVYEKGYANLSKTEKKYATTLKRILTTDRYIEALDQNLQPITRIFPKEIEKSVESFNSITTIVGIISEIGSPKLDDTSHVYLHGIGYKIYISTLQDVELKKYYKDAVLELKVNQKRSIQSGRIISARLIRAKVKANISLTESLKSLTEEDLSLLGNLSNVDDILSFLHQ
jgi:hypothetical protein